MEGSLTKRAEGLHLLYEYLDLPIYTNPLKAEKQHIQVRRVLSKYDLISTLYEHRFSTSGSVYVLGDVDHFVVVGGLILRS